MRILRFLLPLLALSAAYATPDLRTVDQVDLSRYMGRWYVIAHIPNLLERGRIGSADNYTLLPDGRLEAIFTFHRGSLDAPENSWRATGRILDRTTGAVWKVRLLWPLIWPIASGYRILELDPDYQWAVASTESGRLFWVLSRTPTLPEPLYETIVNRLMLRGLETGKLEKVPQR